MIHPNHMRLALAGATAIALASLLAPSSANAGPFREAMLARRTAMQGQDQGQGAGWFGEDGDRGNLQLPPGTRVVRDVAYGGDARDRFDVYAPAQAHNAPVLVMVHGGAWMFGKKDARGVVENKVGHWVPRGLILISVGYPMVPEATPLQQAEHVARALAYAQQHAATWGGDPRRFVLIGHSAGAHLVSLIASSTRIAQQAGAEPWLGTVALDSAAYDVTRIMQSRHFPFYDRAFGNNPADWNAASPLLQLDGRIVPFLAVCSSQREDSCPQAQRFVTKAESYGSRTQLLEEDKTHGEINKELGADPQYTAQVDAFLRTLDPGIAGLLDH